MTQSKRNICFVAMPIGSRDDDSYEKWKKVFDQIIKPAVKKADSDLICHRSDDESRQEPWWPDILKHLYEDSLCIADVTGQNANVYYELGIRDVWTSNTIVITQNFKDVKADRQDNRAILYHESDIKIIREFEDRMVTAIKDIQANPDRVRVRVQEFLAGCQPATIRQPAHKAISEVNDTGTSSAVLPTVPYFDDVDKFRERLGYLLTLKGFKHHWSNVLLDYFEAYEEEKQGNKTLYLVSYRFWEDDSELEEEFFANFVTGVGQYVKALERDPNRVYANTFQGIRDLTVVVLCTKPVEDKRRIISLLRKYIKPCQPVELEIYVKLGLHDHVRLLDRANVVIWDNDKLESFRKKALNQGQ